MTRANQQPHLPDANMAQELKRLRERTLALESRLENMERLREQTDRGTQILLRQKYRELAQRGEVLSFLDVGFQNYSQWEEDGILLYIFSLIGEQTRKAIEICAGVGWESNSANLILNHAWYALLVDGNSDKVKSGQEFFARQPSSALTPPKYLNRWVDRDTVNDLISDAGFAGEVDLFVLDIDGVDYWIWEALEVISPRVVCVEVAAHLGDKSVTVPYAADFELQWIPMTTADGVKIDDGRATALHKFAPYCGASLPAFTKLARKKGYRLIGATHIGSNAFFMRDDVGTQFFPEVDPLSCINASYDAEIRARVNAALEQCDWVEI